MTPIPAQVLVSEKQGNKYHVLVRIGRQSYRGSFNTLAFGDIKPYIGSLSDGKLDLVYHQDPGLREGQQFPLWRIQ